MPKHPFRGSPTTAPARRRSRTTRHGVMTASASVLFLMLLSGPAGAQQSSTQDGKAAGQSTASASSTSEKPSPRRRPGDGETTNLDLDGRALSLQYTPFPIESKERDGFQALQEGEVFSFTSARCFKFKTDVTLVPSPEPNATEEQRVAAHNVHPDYPGIYCLWVVKKDGWQLHFNEQADVWGTMHDPAYDRAVVALDWTQASEEEPALEMKLAEDPDGRIVLEIAWGTDRARAVFQPQP